MTAEPQVSQNAVLGGCLILGAALGLLVWGVSSLSSSDDPDGLSREAKSICREFVDDRLISPSSADYSREEAARSESTWTVTGTVDAENGFGVSLRSSYTCTVTKVGDRWTLNSLVGP